MCSNIGSWSYAALDRIEDYTTWSLPAARSTVATVTLKIRKVRPTFKAFLVDDYGVVLRSLCQTEKLASEWEKKKKPREGRSDSGYRKWKTREKAACWAETFLNLTTAVSFSSAAPWSHIYIKFYAATSVNVYLIILYYIQCCCPPYINFPKCCERNLNDWGVLKYANT